MIQIKESTFQDHLDHAASKESLNVSWVNSQLQKREEAGNELLCAEHSGIAWVDNEPVIIACKLLRTSLH